MVTWDDILEPQGQPTIFLVVGYQLDDDSQIFT